MGAALPTDVEIALANKALEKTKITLMSSPNCVFFATVMLSLKHIWDNSQPTAYTDGRVIAYNMAFFMRMPHLQRVGVVLHETLHVAFMHVCRSMGFDPKKYNYAADYVINLIVIAAGFELPAGCLLDNKYKGMGTEDVYRLLPKDMKEPKDFMDDIRDGTGGDPGELEKLKADLDDILVQAVQQSAASSDNFGSVPASIQFYVNSMLSPVIPWHRLMKSFMTKFAKDDYSMQKINRRFMPDFYLPSLFSEKVCDFAVGTDTSCSVTDEQYGHYAAETMQLLKWLKPEKIHFIQFDTALKPVVELRGIADFKKVEFTGRGGTNIEPLMEWAQKNKPACLIVFSDGQYQAPRTNPGVPVLWIVHDNPNFKAPFGKVIPFVWEGK